MADLRAHYMAVIETASRNLARLDRFGKDNFKEGTVLVFKKECFSGVYQYAALKVEDSTWCTTGGGQYPCKFTWGGLVEFMSVGVYGDIWIAVEWENYDVKEDPPRSKWLDVL